MASLIVFEPVAMYVNTTRNVKKGRHDLAIFAPNPAPDLKEGGAIYSASLRD
jgi:hypothetical protein